MVLGRKEESRVLRVHRKTGDLAQLTLQCSPRRAKGNGSEHGSGPGSLPAAASETLGLPTSSLLSRSEQGGSALCPTMSSRML